MDRLIRCITKDGAIMASAVDSTNIVYTAQKIHQLTPAATAALGRLLTASSMMGAQLKQEGASLTLKVSGDGPIGSMVAVAYSSGCCKGYVVNPHAQAENYPNGKLNVAGVVGKNGILYVMRDYGAGEPYMGQIPLASGEIAEDITSYYAASEQIPTVCALGVLCDKSEGEALLSGGLLIQLLPAAGEEAVARLEKNIRLLEPVTTMLAKGLSIEELVGKALEGFEWEILEERKVAYVCDCSKERVVRAVTSLPNDEILSLADERGFAEAGCQFCNRKYRISKEELLRIVEEKSKKDGEKC